MTWLFENRGALRAAVLPVPRLGQNSAHPPRPQDPGARLGNNRQPVDLRAAPARPPKSHGLRAEQIPTSLSGENG